MAVWMKGSEVVASIREELVCRAEALRSRGVVPCLAIVRLGDRPDDLAYERGAVRRCESAGIRCEVFRYDREASPEELGAGLIKIGNREDVHGILVLRPLPGHIDERGIRRLIPPDKDVDCFSPENMAKLFEGDASGFAPCTAEAVMRMFKHYGVDLSGKRVTVIGRSLVVGKPLAMLLIKENATVTVCHTKTRGLDAQCAAAEILIAAAGQARMVREGFLSHGQIVVDVGVNVDESGNLCGDVDFESAEKIAGMISPVPGGVGTVTASVLAEHVIRAAEAAAQ